MHVLGWSFYFPLCNSRITVIEHWYRLTGIPFVLLSFIPSALQTPKSCWLKRPNNLQGLFLCTLDLEGLQKSGCKVVQAQVLTAFLWQIMLAL